MLERLIQKAIKKGKLSDICHAMEKWLDESEVHYLEDIVCRIDDDEAHDIVRMMLPYGEKWSIETIGDFIATKGVPEDERVNYYLVMNAMYNDHRETAKKYGLDNADFYYALAKEFIEDEDGKPHKVARYFDD
jgi:hypothetical protein